MKFSANRIIFEKDDSWLEKKTKQKNKHVYHVVYGRAHNAAIRKHWVNKENAKNEAKSTILILFSWRIKLDSLGPDSAPAFRESTTTNSEYKSELILASLKPQSEPPAEPIVALFKSKS